MAKTDAVWGIDIGQCAIKALRCLPHDEDNHVVADAFDYIEYSKSSASPTPIRPSWCARHWKQFLSRNSVRGDRVAISVLGPKRPGAFHQAAAGRIEEDSRHRQIRGAAANSLRARRRRVGLPADGGRERRRRLRARDRSRPVRDETRPGRIARSSLSKRPRSRSISFSLRR